MDKDKMKTAFSYIHENDDFSDRMTKRMKEERAKVPTQKRNSRRRTVYSFVAVVCVVAISLSVIIIINENKGFTRPSTSDNENMTQSSTDDESSVTSSIPESGSHNPEATSINYSDLQFAESEAVEYPSGLHQTLENILPPLTDFTLSHSEAVIKATITEIHFNDYSDNYNNTYGSDTIVYKVTIDKIYYVQSGLDIIVGDTVIIEDSLGEESPCTKDSVYQLQLNRQYILPLSYSSEKVGYMESPYNLVDPYIPQIMCTEDGGYVFFAQPVQPIELYWESYSWFGWGELINADTLPVVMDRYELEGLKESLEGVLHFRMDSQFEEDFQALCDQWCG